MKKYEIGIYEKAMPSDLNWKEKLLLAKKYGYDYIELSIDETDAKLERLEWTKKERLELTELAKSVGIPFGSMCLSGHRKYPLGSSDAKIEERGLDIMEKALQLAVDLGIRTVQLAGYDVYYEEGSEETNQRFRKNLKTATDMAAKAGVMMGFETMETEYMNTVEKAMMFVREVNSPYLGVYPDSGNITNAAVNYGTDVLEDLGTGAGHIVALHLKETKPNVFREVPYGKGHVNFEKMISTAWELGVRRFVTEFWYTGSENWRDDIETAVKRMKNILDTFD